MTMFDNHRARFAEGPRTTSKKRSHILCTAARRKVLPGFPIKTPFSNVDEARAYLNGDTITCLRCGHTYKGLGQHLKAIHGWNVDQYQQFYHLPYGRGLVSKGTTKIMRENTLLRIEEGDFIPAPDINTKHIKYPSRTSMFQRKQTRKNIYNSPFHNEALVASGVLLHWRDEDYMKILSRMIKQDRLLYDVCTDPDVPGISAFDNYKAKHPNFAEALAETREELSFQKQQESNRLGKRFDCECRALRDQGLSFRKIGEVLCVTARTVNRRLGKAAK